jgi:soluble lytic murein transglycosylase
LGDLPHLRYLATLSMVAVSCWALAPGEARPATVKALSDQDATAYASAFKAAAQGDFVTAEKATTEVSDKSLVGYLQFQKLMWRDTTASFVQLKGWLAKYADLPGADRIFTLARKRNPAGAKELAPPTVLIASAQTDFLPPPSAKGLAARQAYYGGDVARARRLAEAAGERWVAGLCAFRAQDYQDAAQHFQAVAHQAGTDEWLRAGAAYWAARSLIAAGQPEEAPAMLKLAAASPATFYGMLAERQLGLEAGADPDMVALERAGMMPPPETGGGLIKAAYATLDDRELGHLIQTEPRARRAAALAQIGRMQEAGQELRAGLAASDSDAERRAWSTLALQLNSSVANQASARKAKGFDPDDYPTPQLEPAGGYTIDKALVYAVVRQESRFNPYVVSTRGAMGLMQITPDTAAYAAGDDHMADNPLGLFDTATNLRVGQDYLDMLLRRAAGGDLLKALAAYNAGPGTLLRTQQQVGSDDPLLVMESMPSGQTRVYVESVMASYWIYRRMFGEGAQEALAGSWATADKRPGP